VRRQTCCELQGSLGPL